jgi:hypothetical protein
MILPPIHVTWTGSGSQTCDRKENMDDPADAVNKPTSFKWLRIAISATAVLLGVVHVVWPGLSVDAVTLGLLVVAMLPWLTPLVKSLELPGGWKIEFRDLQRAASRADTAGLLAAEPSGVELGFSFESVATRDPNLALAGLRIEIEKRLSLLAQAHGLDTGRPMGIGQLLRALSQADVLSAEERSILADMTNMLNSAVHGAEVDSRGAGWAIDVGPRLLTSLDERIEEAKRT